jgi:hypothetical protein
MNVQKHCCDFFLQSALLAPFFHLVMPRHVYGPCYAWVEHARGIEGYVTYNLACYVRLRVQNMPGWVSLEKIWMEQMGRLKDKFAAILLYWLHSFPLAYLTFSDKICNKLDLLVQLDWGTNHLHSWTRTSWWYMLGFYSYPIKGCIKKWEGSSSIKSLYSDAHKLACSPSWVKPLRANNEERKCWIWT